MIRLVRAELVKLTTTHTWWIFALLSVAFTVMALLSNGIQAGFMLDPPQELTEPPPDAGASPPPGAETPPPPEEPVGPPPEVAAMSTVAAQAANIYTSGQFIGLLLVMVLGALLITNEFHHQTATATFLTTPRRTLVIGGKLATAALLAAAFWLLSTVLSVIGGAIVLNNLGHGPQLGDSAVLRAVLLNLVGYVIWTILGVALGVLIRNQIASVIVAIVAYFIGLVAQTIVIGLAGYLEQDWLTKAVVLLPSAASDLMTRGADLPGNPPQWVGAAVLIGYGVVAGVIGTLITRTRDIS